MDPPPADRQQQTDCQNGHTEVSRPLLQCLFIFLSLALSFCFVNMTAFSSWRFMSLPSWFYGSNNDMLSHQMGSRLLIRHEHDLILHFDSRTMRHTMASVVGTVLAAGEEQNVEKKFQLTRQAKSIVVFMGAPGDVWSQRMGEIFETFVIRHFERLHRSVIFAKINVDEEPKLASQLCKYPLESLPAIRVFVPKEPLPTTRGDKEGHLEGNGEPNDNAYEETMDETNEKLEHLNHEKEKREPKKEETHDDTLHMISMLKSFFTVYEEIPTYSPPPTLRDVEALIEDVLPEDTQDKMVAIDDKKEVDDNDETALHTSNNLDM